MFFEPTIADSPNADWIWATDNDRLGETDFAARRSFVVNDKIQNATIRVVADFAAVEIEINGKRALNLAAYVAPAEVNVTSMMLAGDNVIEVKATGVPGPSAIAFSLTMIPQSGDPVWVASDASWRTSGDQSIVSFGKVEAERWQMNQVPDITPFAEYNQWKEALGGDGQKIENKSDAKLSPLPSGFEIAKIRDALEGEDSWVSMTIDPRGRFIIGKEQKGLLRLTLSDNRNEVVAAETIDDSLGECRGLLWHNDALYAHANRDNALVRLRDTDGNDRFDEVKKIISTVGGTGHGRNDLTVGPDGAIHVIVGDDVEVPETSPRRARPEATAVKELGHWARVVQAGDVVTWEAMNRGLRNPYGIDFNADGEAFTYDADNEGDIGLPFYRPTSINHLVSGANYGWHQDRNQTRSLPGYAPDSVPTALDLDRGSPTAVKFGSRSHFPSPWREALFVLDWAYGRIIAVHLTPNGASYSGSAELFVEGRPLNVTDLDFDADGAMWFITGGRKTKSALYRVRYNGEPSKVAISTSVQSAARAEFSQRARKLRQQLERFHGRNDSAAISEAWPHLGSADPWIRNAARVAIEWQPVEEWRSLALDAHADLAGLTEILGLARAGTDNDRSEIAKLILRFKPTSGWSDLRKLTLLRIAELSETASDQATTTKSVLQSLALATDASDSVGREVARRLVSLESPHAVTFGLERLASASNQLERLHYLELLSEAKTGWTSEQRKLFFTTFSYAKNFSYGDRFMAPFFESVQTSALENVPDSEERKRLAGLLVETQEVPLPAATSRPFVKQWTVSDVISGAASQTGSKPDLIRGRELFNAAMCANCHVCGVEGRPVGPDLTTVGRRFSRQEILESIIEPSKVIAEAYRNVVVLHHDGKTTTGRIVQNDFRESKLVLATNEITVSRLQTISKDDIETWNESPVSPMPTGLLETLTNQEINDLLAYLLSEGQIK